VLDRCWLGVGCWVLLLSAVGFAYSAAQLLSTHITIITAHLATFTLSLLQSQQQNDSTAHSTCMKSTAGLVTSLIAHRHPP